MVFVPAGSWAQRAGPYAATPQRPTFTVGTTTTAPGTLEVELGATASAEFFALPANIKYTPDVARGWLHRGEFSVNFDGITSVRAAGGRITRFGDQIGVVFRRPVYTGRTFSLAIAPRALLPAHKESSGRVGLRVLAAEEFGRNAVVGNITWTAATQTSPSNPRHLWEIAGDFSRTLAAGGALSRLAVFAGAQYVKGVSQQAKVNFGQGVSYRLRPNLVLDFAVRQRVSGAGSGEIRFLTGLTANLGRLFNR